MPTFHKIPKKCKYSKKPRHDISNCKYCYDYELKMNCLSPQHTSAKEELLTSIFGPMSRFRKIK